jgi:hypothetical protein
MSLRDVMNKNPIVAIGATAAVVVLALVFIVMQMKSPEVAKPASGLYFSVDDGKTFFTGETGKIAPFDYNGQPAVRAHVFEINGAKKVGYLEKFSDAGKARAEKAIARKRFMVDDFENDILIKKPGDKKWTARNDPDRAGAIMSVTGPDGKPLIEVYPQ